jgi:hypothetical protein
LRRQLQGTQITPIITSNQMMLAREKKGKLKIV